MVVLLQQLACDFFYIFKKKRVKIKPPMLLETIKNELTFAYEEVPVSKECAFWLRGQNHILRQISQSTRARVNVEGGVRENRPRRDEAPKADGNSSPSTRKETTEQTTEQKGDVDMQTSPDVPATAKKEKEQESDAVPETKLVITGARPCVDDARCAVDIHLSYWPISNEMNILDRELDQAKRSLQRDLGMI
jgi:hypothetical protein